MSMGRISTYFNHPHMDPLISCAWDRRQGSLRSWITTTRPWQPWQLACLPFDHLGYHRAHYADKSRPIVSIIVDFKNVLSCFCWFPFSFQDYFFIRHAADLSQGDGSILHNPHPNQNSLAGVVPSQFRFDES